MSDVSNGAAPSTRPGQSKEEKLEEAKRLKDEGNRLFKDGDVKEALRKYHMAILYFNGLDQEHPGTKEKVSEHIKQHVKALKVTVYNNLAACHAKLGNWEKVVSNADKVIAEDSKNCKALFRRGQGFIELGNIPKAEADLLAANKLEPNDALIQKEMKRVREKNLEAEKKLKQTLSGMFDKLKAREDDESALAAVAAASMFDTPPAVTTDPLEESRDLIQPHINLEANRSNS